MCRKFTILVQVSRPELDPAERAKRMEAIKQAAAHLLAEACKIHNTEVNT